MAEKYITDRIVEILESDMDREKKEYKLKRLKRKNLQDYYGKRINPELVRDHATGEVRKV
mgnify:FL=1